MSEAVESYGRTVPGREKAPRMAYKSGEDGGNERAKDVSLMERTGESGEQMEGAWAGGQL